MTKLKLGTFILALVAALALASTAGAKGGASCAQILDFNVTPGYSGDQPVFTTSYRIDNTCVDHEKMSGRAIEYRNDATGFVGRAFTPLSYGLNTYTGVSAATPETSYTITLTVYAPNGKVADTRSQTIVTPAG
jgi:hypothetical protein